jgi:2-dehydro-3-deoxyphosphooctonate aldolase (KDO 8-P synthase)
VREVVVDSIKVGRGNPVVLIAGPCVIEDEESCYRTAEGLASITKKLSIPFIFKSSYDKANRTSIHSFRGPGLREGLKILKSIKEKLKVPILSDVHCVEEVEEVAKVVDIIQIPAFLCRQTDLVQKVASTGRVVNVKKGQFLAPHDIKYIVEKITSRGNEKILLTERGTTFGYNNLVVDMRSISIMRSTGFPVVFDATHSVQLPGGAGDHSLGEREFVFPLARAAVAAGCDGLFVEVHPQPDAALCDGANMLSMDELEKLLSQTIAIDKVIRSFRSFIDEGKYLT